MQIERVDSRYLKIGYLLISGIILYILIFNIHVLFWIVPLNGSVRTQNTVEKAHGNWGKIREKVQGVGKRNPKRGQVGAKVGKTFTSSRAVV
jgi:hypothetical protein